MNKSAKRTLEILDFVSNTGYPLTLKQISEGLEIPPSSTFDIVSTMLDKNYLQMEDPDTKTYTIGLAAFQAGAAYVRGIDIVSVARPYLRKMARKSGAVAFLGIRSKDNVVYMDRVEGRSDAKASARLGKKYGLYCTGLGKALLATMPTHEVEQLYQGKTLIRRTDHTICDLDKLKEELFQIRQKGVAFDNEEDENGICCVAAPVRGYDGNTLAAVGITNRRELLGEQQVRVNSDMIKKYAARISEELGYGGDNLFYIREQ